jgi:hypothetical protein
MRAHLRAARGTGIDTCEVCKELQSYEFEACTIHVGLLLRGSLYYYIKFAKLDAILSACTPLY